MRLLHVIVTAVFVMLFTISVQAQIKVACVGNSITQGFMGNPSYCDPLLDSLGSDYTIYNGGWSGQTLCKMNGNNSSYWTYGRISEVIALQPDIITIMLGTNDATVSRWTAYGSTDFVSDYEALIDTLRTNNAEVDIFVVLPPPLFPGGAYTDTTSWNWNSSSLRDSLVNVEIPLIKQVAAAKGVKVLDANTPLQGLESYFADKVHPNDAGAEVLASVFYNGIIGKEYMVVDTTDTITAVSTTIPFAVSGLSVYPNPAEDMIIIEATNEGVFTLVDEKGRVVTSLSLGKNDLSNVTAGTYYVLQHNRNTLIGKNRIYIVETYK